MIENKNPESQFSTYLNSLNRKTRSDFSNTLRVYLYVAIAFHFFSIILLGFFFHIRARREIAQQQINLHAVLVQKKITERTCNDLLCSL